VKYGLEPVSVEVDHERRVVSGAALRTETGRSRVQSARANGDGVERCDRVSARGHEREVEARLGRAAPVRRREERELLVAISGTTVADGAGVREEPDVAERPEHRVIERCGAREIGDAEGEVVDHARRSVAWVWTGTRGEADVERGSDLDLDSDLDIDPDGTNAACVRVR